MRDGNYFDEHIHYMKDNLDLGDGTWMQMDKSDAELLLSVSKETGDTDIYILYEKKQFVGRRGFVVDVVDGNVIVNKSLQKDD